MAIYQSSIANTFLFFVVFLVRVFAFHLLCYARFDYFHFFIFRACSICVRYFRLFAVCLVLAFYLLHSPYISLYLIGRVLSSAILFALHCSFRFHLCFFFVLLFCVVLLYAFSFSCRTRRTWLSSSTSCPKASAMPA